MKRLAIEVFSKEFLLIELKIHNLCSFDTSILKTCHVGHRT